MAERYLQAWIPYWPLLAAFLLCVFAGCGGQQEVVATATATATPTPTWEQWLGTQMARNICEDPSHNMLYRDPTKTPPYSAEFLCRAPEPTPNTVATAVATTIAAQSLSPAPTYVLTPQPTRIPISTTKPTPRPTATPRPTEAPKPRQTPTIEQMVAWASGTAEAKRKCDQAGGDFRISNIREGEGSKWTWNYKCAQQPGTGAPQPQEDRDIAQELIRCGTSLEVVVGMAMSGGLDLSPIATCMVPHLLEALDDMFSLVDSILTNDGGTNPHLRAEFDHSTVVPAGEERRISARAERYGYLNYKFVSVKDTYSKEPLKLRFSTTVL